MALLGDGDNVAFLYERGGAKRIAQIPGQVGVSWGRVLDDISDGTVSCLIPGDVGADREECCRILGNIHTWAHELVIFRNGHRVWEGPVTRVSEVGANVNIAAQDVLGWTRRRAHRGRVAAGVYVVNELVSMLQAAFLEHDPNVLGYLDVRGAGTGVQVDREVLVNSCYYAEDLDQLGDQGANFTTVGRRVVVWPDRLTLGRVSRLEPGKHLVAEVEIIEDGMILATRVAARNDQDESAKSTVGTAVDTFYGLVEGITEASSVVGVPALTAVANSVRKDSYPAAAIINIPDGSTLTCDAPFDISELVPGVIVPISTKMTCRPVASDQLLSSLLVTQDETGESVQVNLTPLSASVLG